MYIALSLDGQIARADGGLDWLETVPNPDGSDFGFAEFLSRVDALLMGRATFEKVLSFGEWPYSLPVFVASSTLQGVPEALSGKAEILSGTAEEMRAALQARGYENLYIDGGRLIQNFLKADLIDELILTRFPILLGEGIPLFSALPAPLPFEHVETELIANMLTKSRYVRKRSQGVVLTV